MSLTNPGKDAECRFCYNPRETFYHYVTECPSLLTYRAQAFQDYNGPLMEDWSPHEVMKFSEEREISEAIDYYEWLEEGEVIVSDDEDL